MTETRDLGLDRVAHTADEHRQSKADRNGVAITIKEPNREVERFIDDHVVGCPHQIGLHLLGRGDEAVADDLGSDQIDAGRQRRHQLDYTGITRLPRSSTTATSPGGSTVVDAYSWISAGPVI